MIGLIKGQIISTEPPVITIDVNGVGYEVHTPMSTFYDVSSPNETITLITHLIVREDHHALYGFTTSSERELFRYLIKVNGIGPKLALTMLSSMDQQQLTQNIINNQVTALTKIPGIGKKTAERLVIEMRSKLEHLAIQTSPSDDNTLNSHATEDAIRALNALGYKPQEAKRAVNAVQSPEHNSEQLIRLALQQMIKG